MHEKDDKEILVLNVILLFDDVRKITFTSNAVDSNKNQCRISLLHVHRFENVDVTK